MSNKVETLGDALPKEMARVREVIEQDLRAADAAVMSGDVVAMLKAYKTLQAIEA